MQRKDVRRKILTVRKHVVLAGGIKVRRFSRSESPRHPRSWYKTNILTVRIQDHEYLRFKSDMQAAGSGPPILACHTDERLLFIKFSR